MKPQLRVSGRVYSSMHTTCAWIGIGRVEGAPTDTPLLCTAPTAPCSHDDPHVLVKDPTVDLINMHVGFALRSLSRNSNLFTPSNVDSGISPFHLFLL